MKGLLENLWDSISKSSLVPLLSHGIKRWTLQQHPDQHELKNQGNNGSLNNIQARLSSQDLGSDTLAAYNKIIERLHDARRCMTSWEGTDALVWIYRSLEDLIPRLALKEQEALVLLAHFAVVLKSCETQWWLHGWSHQIMSGIYQKLDEDHKMWVYGPAAEIGWVFPQHHE